MRATETVSVADLQLKVIKPQGQGMQEAKMVDHKPSALAHVQIILSAEQQSLKQIQPSTNY